MSFDHKVTTRAYLFDKAKLASMGEENWELVAVDEHYAYWKKYYCDENYFSGVEDNDTDFIESLVKRAEEEWVDDE